MPSIPFYLVTLIFVIVVLPFFVAITLRLLLYAHLTYLHKRVEKLIREEKSSQELEEKLEEEPEMIKRLIRRFKKASGVLEQVNTPALLDQIYSQEKVWFFFCEQIEYFCRILPNLLLAFGLFGTFLGITISLSAISQTLSQTNATSDVSNLVNKLQEPLQGMGIAFVASLAGLSFSTLLIFFNFRVNTVLAKCQLISSLEDYLDNIYQPTIEGHSRLDKAVEKMVSKFNEFLSRFGETVRGAVESSLKDKLQEIFDANIQATDLAREVYSRFLDASGTLERGATIFKEFAEVIECTQFPDKVSTFTEGLANAHRELSQSSLILNDSMKLTESATNLLHSSVVEIAQLNKKTSQVLELTQGSQQSLREIIPQLHQGAQMLQPAVEILADLQQKIEIREDKLGNIQIELKELVENIKKHTEQVSLEIRALRNQPVKNSTEQNKVNNFNNYHTQTENNNMEIQSRNDSNTSQEFEKDARQTGRQKNVVKKHIDPPPLQGESGTYNSHQEQFQKASNAYINGKYEEAAVIINALIKKFPKTPQYHLLQGNIYYKLGDHNIAQLAYQLVLDISVDLQLKEHARKGLANINGVVKSF